MAAATHRELGRQDLWAPILQASDCIQTRWRMSFVSTEPRTGAVAATMLRVIDAEQLALPTLATLVVP